MAAWVDISALAVGQACDDPPLKTSLIAITISGAIDCTVSLWPTA
jgi:hypothetical protein